MESHEPPQKMMDPTVIRYSQDSIAKRFRCGRFLQDTFKQLQIGQISVRNIPSTYGVLLPVPPVGLISLSSLGKAAHKRCPDT